MPRRVLARPIGFEDRLSVVDHLDELRNRLFVCVAFLIVAFGVCFWQNHPLLNLLNHPLPVGGNTSPNHLNGLTEDSVKASRYFTRAGADLLAAARSAHLPAAATALLQAAAQNIHDAARELPQSTPARLPVTLGVGESFTTTLVVCAYFALLITLPLIIYQAYAYVIPALNPKERRLAGPIVLAAPLLFLIGAAFCYFLILPPAVHFLQGYNSQDFDNLVQAAPLYKFEIFTMLGVGVAFQLPLGLLGLQQAGVMNGSTLTRHWRYALLIIAVIAAAMPGADPVSTLFETLPLLVLYLASILLLKFGDRRSARHAELSLDDLPVTDADAVTPDDQIPTAGGVE
jgi:sec-independent protein translocase protein TatC